MPIGKRKRPIEVDNDDEDEDDQQEQEGQEKEGEGEPRGGRARRKSTQGMASLKDLSSSSSDENDSSDEDDEDMVSSSGGKGEKGAAAAAAASEEEEEEEAGGAAGKGRNKGKGKGKAKAVPKKANNRKGMAPHSKTSLTPAQVLKGLRGLKAEMRAKSGATAPTMLELGLTGTVKEVKEMTNSAVAQEIERVAVQVVRSILAGKGFSYEVPTRSSSNQRYVPEVDRIVLGDKVTHRTFISTAGVRKTAITTRVMQCVHEILHKGIHITKRDLFYTDVKLFKDQGESDVVLDDVACMVGCTRSCLNVVASDKGLVVGRVSFREDGDYIDCTRMGVGGKAIPPYTDKITEIRSDADFILLVEKEAAYMRLAEDRFYNKFPCIVITAKGQPDVATRMFLKRLKSELNIPVMGLVDSDPYGLKILSVYMSGSKNMSYDSASLTTPDIKWLGVRPSDLARYNIPEQCRLDMTEYDIKTGKELLEEDFIKKNTAWHKELELMIKTKKKAEIQALSAFGFQYLTEVYLPQKLRANDWI